MCDPARMKTYRKIWKQVQQAYNGGFIVSERGLQAVLYGELQTRLRGVHVVVEPTWTMADGTKKKPDLVIIEGGEITDIFELKFVPHYRALWRGDLEKLRAYIGNTQYDVRLTPQTGQWAARRLPVRADCCLHFAVIARYGRAVVRLSGHTGINHWYGRVGSASRWDIRFA